jgi:hypothetical protein
MDLIGIRVKQDNIQSQSQDVIKRFVVPIENYRETIIRRVADFKIDSNIYVNERNHSCFGQALNACISIC